MTRAQGFTLRKSTIVKLGLLLIVASIVFQEMLVSLGLSFFGGIDELLVSIGLVLIALKVFFRQDRDRVDLLVIVGFVYFVFVSLFFGEQKDVSAIILQSIIHLKLLIIFSMTRMVVAKFQLSSSISRLFFLLAGITAFGIFLNAAVGERFIELIGGASSYRFGELRYVGFQEKPNDASILLSFFFLAVVAGLGASGKRISLRLAAFLIVCVVAVLVNGSRTALLVFPISIALWIWFRRSLPLALAAIAGLGAVAAIYSSEIANMYGESVRNVGELNTIYSSEYIRAIMISTGYKIMLTHFPIGTGAASFGSALSVSSPVYAEYGLFGTEFYRDFWGLFDSNLATIMGEFGFAGLVFFYFLTPIAIFRDIRSAFSEKTAASGKESAFVLSALVVGGVVSLTNPFFMYQYSSVVFCLALFTFYAIARPGFGVKPK